MSKSVAVQELLEGVRAGEIDSIEKLNKAKNKIAKKYALFGVPSTIEIISSASKKEREDFRNILNRKPTRSLSGINVVAVMTKPFDCVGKCIYCPSSLVLGKKTPKSYTGREPSTMRGLMFNFNPFKIVQNRLKQYEDTNNASSKIELILQGGTFSALPFAHQKYFVKRCYDAVLGKKTSSLSEAKKLCEVSEKRVVGLAIETRPDWCKEKEINRMLVLGATKVELGVQIPDDAVYKLINRGHTVKDVVQATQLLKDSSFKIVYHLMPGLFGSSFENDLKNLKRIFLEGQFKPDMIKIYPTLVIEKTALHSIWKNRLFTPMSVQQAAKIIVEIKKVIPMYVRVMRVQRDIPSTVVSAGPNKTNLRQFVEQEMQEQKVRCNCIRCREVGLKAVREKIDLNLCQPELMRVDYNASGGKEVFLSIEDKKFGLLFGFCRLRIPFKPFRKEITSSTALIRELHVYSRALQIGKVPKEKEFQHRGFGKQLMVQAEKIAKEEFDARKCVVISGIGVKEYYKKYFSYSDEGPFVSKSLT